MRKAIGLKTALLFVIAMVLMSGTAFGGQETTGNQTPSGAHWNINIIGHPKKGISGDYSSGHSIIIPLRNVNGQTLLCGDGVQVFDDNGQTTDIEPTGAKIYFKAGDHFEIIDRDATDSNGATIMVPVGDADPVTGDIPVNFDVYIRVLGKPNKCMNINAFAYDLDQNLWYQTGTVSLSRKTGKSVFVTANILFTVCITDPVTNQCTGAYRSVFNTVFDSYFWSILNDGTRLVQLRLYQR